MSNPYDPSYVQYAGNAPQSADNGHVTALAICHYVYAGIVALLGIFPGMYIFLGVMVVSTGALFGSPLKPGDESIGWVFLVMGSLGLLFAEASALLNLLSGLGLSKRKRFVLIMVTSGLNCLNFPMGTLLGIFTFVVALRPSVKAQFGHR